MGRYFTTVLTVEQINQLLKLAKQHTPNRGKNKDDRVVLAIPTTAPQFTSIDTDDFEHGENERLVAWKHALPAIGIAFCEEDVHEGTMSNFEGNLAIDL